ncbi:peptidoglycan-binding domain-containing protein [Marinobacter similis]|uniref:peptidoglycan-binding domain-containing protein n=1 Tax=Marinobacter similis TaxID=1420916 RepID=UPI000A561DDE|nr:peptidoglycan-binding domain-containing protein [Marinobacter similis]
MSNTKKMTNNLGRLAIAAGTVMMLGLAPAVSANNTVAVKNALYGAGYEIQNVSAQMDDSTRAALTEFQKDNGLQATGTLDEETKKALGMISVQVAAASNGSSQSASNDDASNSSASVETDDKTEGAIEEDEEGGWSLW